MEFGLGALNWSPDEFWNSTFYELSCAYIGYCRVNGVGRFAVDESGWSDASVDLFRKEVEEMKRRFPD